MRLLFAVDTFPPLCGGSGWSAFEQARAMMASGHEVTVIRPGQGDEDGYQGVPVLVVPRQRTTTPLVRHLVQRELFPRHFQSALRDLLRRERFDIVHAQHVITGPPAIEAARECGVPSVITVRDYWPVCFWGTKMSGASRCAGCSTLRILRCLAANSPASLPVFPLAIPYVNAYLKRLRRAIARADRVVAISERIKAELTTFLPESGVRVIPNFVEAAGGVGEPATPPYLSFAGKLTTMKGVLELLDAIRLARLDIPVVFIGDGPLRARVDREIELGRIKGLVTGWVERERMMQIVGGALFNLFPTRWDEPLGRVVIEAASVGRTSIVLAPWGRIGPHDILEDGTSGVFVRTVDEFAAAMRRLAGDPARVAALGKAAWQRVAEHLAARAVLPSLLALYEEVVRHTAQNSTAASEANFEL